MLSLDVSAFAALLKGMALMMQGKPAEALPIFSDEPDETFRAHGQAIADHDLGRMDEYQAEDDPRWLPFLRKVGIAPEQLAEIRFEVEAVPGT